MSALPTKDRYTDQLQWASMQVSDIDEVVHIEQQAYPFPWTRGNFVDSLSTHYDAWVLRDANQLLAGYFLLMHAVDEVHLLNITVRPDLQGRGVGRLLLDKVRQQATEAGMTSVLLEVRPSNQHALMVYGHLGFEHIGLRKNYYPAGSGEREDAIVMRLTLNAESR